jgi:NAD(P)-dependent dehydrogenase (short-subunit alcohol dehydrogenase family)
MASNTLMAGPNGFLHEAVAYNTSKAAANSYTIALAHELKAEGIKVNAVTPGFTTTRLNGFAPGGKTPEQGAQTLAEWALLGKDGKTGGFCASLLLGSEPHWFAGLFVNDAGEFPW